MQLHICADTLTAVGSVISDLGTLGKSSKERSVSGLLLNVNYLTFVQCGSCQNSSFGCPSISFGRIESHVYVLIALSKLQALNIDFQPLLKI